jgi:hypothetical protein
MFWKSRFPGLVGTLEICNYRNLQALWGGGGLILCADRDQETFHPPGLIMCTDILS